MCSCQLKALGPKVLSRALKAGSRGIRKTTKTLSVTVHVAIWQVHWHTCIDYRAQCSGECQVCEGRELLVQLLLLGLLVAVVAVLLLVLLVVLLVFRAVGAAAGACGGAVVCVGGGGVAAGAAADVVAFRAARLWRRGGPPKANLEARGLNVDGYT